MRIIKDCYDNIGMFDTRCGTIFLSYESLIIPVSNLQIEIDESIKYIDYCYLVFENIESSKRNIFYNGDIFTQKNITFGKSYRNLNYYNLDLVDIINPEYQYAWEIIAEKFHLQIPEYGGIKGNYTPNDFLNKNHFFEFEKYTF